MVIEIAIVALFIVHNNSISADRNTLSLVVDNSMGSRYANKTEGRVGVGTNITVRITAGQVAVGSVDVPVWGVAAKTSSRVTDNAALVYVAAYLAGGSNEERSIVTRCALSCTAIACQAVDVTPTGN